jgi:hypothetical protein
MTRFLLLFFGRHLAQALLRGRAELARVFFPALFFGCLIAKPPAAARRSDARYDHKSREDGRPSHGASLLTARLLAWATISGRPRRLCAYSANARVGVLVAIET